MIVINNYFSGVLKRGIPIYTEELVIQMRKKSIKVIELKCPRLMHRLPFSIHNLMFVFYDQVLTPLLGLIVRSKYNIYPYNSVSILDSFIGKSVIIIHDLISLHKSKRSLSSKYVSFCLSTGSNFKSDYIYISKTTKRVIDNINLFNDSMGFYFPNTFYRFERIASETVRKDEGYILLVSGNGENKDLCGALELYFSLKDNFRLPLKILGCGNDLGFVNHLLENYEGRHLVEVIPFIDMRDVVSLYCSSTFIWAHSKHEGYGRAVAEAKLSHKKILCSRIAAFSEQKDCNVYLYSNKDSFENQVKAISFSDFSMNEEKLIEHRIFEQQLGVLNEKE